MTDEFDWNDDEDIAVEWQGAIAVYRNKAGAIVVRQEAHVVGDEDSFVVVRPENLRRLIDRLLAVSAEIVTDEAVGKLIEK